MKKTKRMLEIEEKFGEDLGDLLRRKYPEENTVEIGEELGVNSVTIYNWLKGYGIKIRNRSEMQLPADFVMPTKEELESIYWKEGKTTYEIAERFGVNNVTIYNWLKKYEIEIKSRLPADFVKPTKEELEKKYWNDGKSTCDIAKEIGVSQNTIGRWFNEYGIKIRNNSESKLSPGAVKPTKEEMEKMYVKEKMSTVEIGKRLGFNASTISNWLEEYEIEIRNISESKLPVGVFKPTKEELESMYVKQGISANNIAKYYKVDPGTIGRWLKGYEIKVRNKKGIYDDKELRRKCIDELLEDTGKKANELATSDFKIKKKNGICCTGVLSWYQRNYNCSQADARDILVQDLFGIKNLSVEEKLEKEKQQLEKLLEGYANEKNQTNAGN